MSACVIGIGRRHSVHMESTYFKTLIEVAKTGSLTKAADSLCVTQSAVSRRIKYLETQYGIPLLNRDGPLLVLTEAGEVVNNKAKRILDIEQELKQELCIPDRDQDISFVCTPSFGIIHLPKVMQAFMRVCPDDNNLNFIFKMPDEIYSGLKNGAYDIAVMEHCQCYDFSDFDTFALPSDEMVFAAAPTLQRGSAEQPLEKLKNQTLYSRKAGCCSRTLLESNLQSQNKDLHIFKRVIAFDDLQVIINALADGLGIAFISAELVAPYVKTGKLETFTIPGFIHQRQRTFVSAPQLPRKCSAALFTKTLLETCC